MNDREIMAAAFEEAKSAYERGECPVGAVIVRNGDIVARAGNRGDRIEESYSSCRNSGLERSG